MLSSGLAQRIAAYKHKVEILVMPSVELKAIDDYIYEKGFVEFSKLMDNTLTIKEFAQKHKPDLNEFIQIFNEKNSYFWCFDQCEGECINSLLND